MSNESTVGSLLGSVSQDDPQLYNLLQLLIQDLYAAYNVTFPPTAANAFGVTGQLPTTAQVQNLTATLYPNNLRLAWDSIGGLTQYEIRYHSGTDTTWNTASVVLVTPTLSADINPIAIPLIYGNHTFLIKAIDANGIYSSVATTVTVNIPQIDAPVISATVIDNNVLLGWTSPALTFQLDRYNIYRDGVAIGTMTGTFEAIFETVAGTFTYSVEAVDIVGNVGTLGYIVAIVNQPPDYELQDDRISDLSGTKVNTFLDTSLASLICDIDVTKTWTTHFTAHGWTSPQDQINAGFPYFIQPTSLTGSYEEIVDYGTTVNNIILSLRWALSILDGNVTAIAKIAFSLDNITYTAFVTGSSLFSASMRYAKVHIDFAATDTTGLALFSNLEELLDVKREVDSGAVNALATDATGTQVNFNKAFKDVDSITLTVGSTEPVTAIYDFVDIPNPVGFKVYIFDSSGNRATYPVSWKARGIV